MSHTDTIQTITRGTTEVIHTEGLKKKLAAGRPLCIKAGFDPTAPDIHLGHVVLLRKLRQFQDLGHHVHFLIGDFTAQVGDPSGKDQLRPKMDIKTIADNAKTYKAQVFKILDEAKTKVVFNSKWLSKLSSQKLLELTAHSTVAQMLARSDFKKRYEDGREISILEFIYPLLQGYDSLHMKADIELGGNDQKFNLLMGRQLQEVFRQEPQVIIMTPLLEGTDGIKKMSKSLDNYIGINEAPKDIFGKVMSINDELMLKYYEHLTDVDLNEVKLMHPKKAKLRLAAEIVQQFYDKDTALKAEGDFEKIFAQNKCPDDMPEYRLSDNEESVGCVLLKSGLVGSKRELQRLLKEGAVNHDGVKVVESGCVCRRGVLKVGKRRFLKIIKE